MKIFALFALIALVSGQIIDTLLDNVGLFNPIGMNQDNLGLYVCDSFNNRVQRFNLTDKSITTVYTSGGPTTNPSAIAFVDGNFAVTLPADDQILFINTANLTTLRVCGATPTNCGNAANIATPDDIKNDRNLFLYFSELTGNRVQKITLADLSISVFAGTGATGYTGDNGPATAATFNFVAGLALDKQNNVYISDLSNNVIRVVNAQTNIVTTFAGNGTAGNEGNGGPAILATFNAPINIAFDVFGNLFVAQQFGLRKIDINGIVSFVSKDAGIAGFAGDGTDVSNALFSGLRYLFFTQIGDLLVSDTDANPNNNRIRIIKFANETCKDDLDCLFPCRSSKCDVSGVCSLGFADVTLAAPGDICFESNLQGVCDVFGACIDLKPIVNFAVGLKLSTMLMQTLAVFWAVMLFLF